MSVAARNSTSITLGEALAVRASVVCSGSYVVTQDDVNALEVSSTANVAAGDASGNMVAATGTAVVSLDQAS